MTHTIDYPTARDRWTMRALSPLWVVMALFASCCVPASPPATPVKPNGPGSIRPLRAFDVDPCALKSADGSCAQPIAGATVRINTHASPTDDHLQIANGDGYTAWQLQGQNDTEDASIFIAADGFEPYDSGTVHLNELASAVHNIIVLRRVAPPRPFPAESGPLHIVGKRFVDQDGQVWSWRGATQFLTFARALAGESVAAQVQGAINAGVNVLREFGQVNWPDAFAAPLHFSQPWRDAAFDAKLDAHFAMLEAAGERVEFVPLTYADALSTQRAYLQRVYDVAARHWNVFIEAANEPENNGIDPVAAMVGVERHGVLSSYGLDPARTDCASQATCFIVPVLDYVTTHDLARDDAHSPRNTKDAMEMQNVLEHPVVCDEPIGIIDPTHYPSYVPRGGTIWSAPSGGGVRTVNPNVVADGAYIASLYAPGYTLHTQAGLEGRWPGDDEPIQRAAAALLLKVWQFLPARAQIGAYSRPGLPEFGLPWTDGDTDSQVGHAYQSTSGNVAYAINPMPAAGWTARTVSPWRVDAVGPLPEMLRLVR